MKNILFPFSKAVLKTHVDCRPTRPYMCRCYMHCDTGCGESDWALRRQKVQTLMYKHIRCFTVIEISASPIGYIMSNCCFEDLAQLGVYTSHSLYKTRLVVLPHM